jgi:nucleolar protein 56
MYLCVSSPFVVGAVACVRFSDGFRTAQVAEADEIASLTAEVQAAVGELARFSKMVKLKAFAPFASAEDALANMNAVSEHQVSVSLPSLLSCLYFSVRVSSSVSLGRRLLLARERGAPRPAW